MVNAPKCPVCQFTLEFAPYERELPSFEICSCCGTQFGYDDAAATHLELRAKWIESGRSWWSSEPPPPHWDAESQLDPPD